MQLLNINNERIIGRRASQRQRRLLFGQELITEEYNPVSIPNVDIATLATRPCSFSNVAINTVDCETRTEDGPRIVLRSQPNLFATTVSTDTLREYTSSNDERVDRLESEITEIREILQRLIERDIS